MALSPTLAPAKEEEDEEEEEAPSHLPLAPSSELFDVSTTVDPSYIISLIRQLLPHDSKENNIKEDGVNGFDGEKSTLAETKDPWEECGCILWDLAASITQAELMVNSLVLEVLLANLHISKSLRVKEICLGILGNLACHESLSNTIKSQHGLIQTVVDQLFLDDSACLSETFRLLAAGLQGSEFASWAKALVPDEILLRVLWIVGNTLNAILFEKSMDFLLTITDKQEVASLLLEPLMKLGLLNLSVSLLSCEIDKRGDENKLERSSALAIVLRLIEALSAIDSCSQLMPSNEQLLQLLCSIVKLPDKFEVASYCTYAVVIMANLLADDKHLLSGLSHDFPFLEGLLDILPLVSDDSQARNALWCILANLLLQVQEKGTSSSSPHQFVSVLMDKSDVIEQDLENHALDQLDEGSTPDAFAKLYGVTTALRRIGHLVEEWITRKSGDVAENEDCVGKARKLLDYCRYYVL